MPGQKIGIIGAGTMGIGIAQTALLNGFEVVIKDVKMDYINQGVRTLKKNLHRLVKKGKLKEEKFSDMMEKVTATVEMAEFADVDFVIEAAVEKMGIKKDIFKELDKICSTDVLLVSNTSGLSITEIASVTQHPERVAGMHFFNPVPVMKLVEVIKGTETSRNNLEKVIAFAKELGKEPIEVKEAPLFTVNRILVPMINEAIFVLMEGISSAEDIDKGMKLGANHPLGPLALADLIGLDVLLDVMETLYQETCDSKYRPCPLLRKKVRAGHLGRKSGKGFYEY